MLASITPLGERGRGFSWRITAAAFSLGAVAAGTLAGAALGAAGTLVPGGAWRAPALLAVLAVALAFDATALRHRLPTSRRQVNEDWLHRYRGWVYGSAFGAQLGVGVATIVTSAAVYATAIGAALAGSAAAGALIGGAFGLTRAASLLPARTARDPAALARLHRAAAALEPQARCLVVGAEVLAAALLTGVLA